MTASRTAAMILSHLASAPRDARSSAGISKATRLGSGALFPALAALEYDKLIVSDWEDMPPPRRRLYTLTEAGRQQVGAMSPVEVQPRPGVGNWLWQRLVAPFFGG